MKLKKIVICAFVVTFGLSCTSQNKESKVKALELPNAALQSQSDSLAYVIGVSMAQNILKVDSLINLEVVATAIAQYGKDLSPFDAEQARALFLKHKLHIEPERSRGYEESYLEEMAAANRALTRTKSGITYNVSEVGSVSNSPRSSSDWIEINYTVSRVDSTQIYSTYETEKPLSGALSSLSDGVMECVKLIGRGGKISAYIPSELVYGAKGDEELGVEPFETLRYDIELTGYIKDGAKKKVVDRSPANF